METSDLEKIGMGKPAARRLMEAVKKRKTQQWKRNLIHKIIPVSSNSKQVAGTYDITSNKVPDVTNNGSGLTCLIQEKDIRYVLKYFVSRK